MNLRTGARPDWTPYQLERKQVMGCVEAWEQCVPGTFLAQAEDCRNQGVAAISSEPCFEDQVKRSFFRFSESGEARASKNAGALFFETKRS